MFRLSYFLLGYLVFLFFGALIFHELNGVEEKKQHIRVNNQIRQFIKRNKKCLKEHDLYPYVDYFLDRSHTGLWLPSTSKLNITKWTFGQGLFFATSLVTTVGYGTHSLITPYGKFLCIIYTIIGLSFALLFQQILHRWLISMVDDIISQLTINRRMIYYFTKHRSYLLSFLVVVCLIILVFIVIPTLFIHRMYVPNWSLIELTYFLVTTNHLIGFGDLVPCTDFYDTSRSRCAMIMTVYVIIQILTAGILGHMCWMFPKKNRQFSILRRHNSDSVDYMINSKRISIDIEKRVLMPNVYT